MHRIKEDQCLNSSTKEYSVSLKLIFVAGYPHLKNDDVIYEESIEHLEEEVKEGADFVITQMVFHADNLVSFIKQCRQRGIAVPIIPGILPIQVC